MAGDPFAAETLGRHLSRRIAELADSPDTPLFFGKIDIAADEDDEGGLFHVGRRHVTDAAGEPMVLDWRAPISRKFLPGPASRDPQGVATRRRFGFVKGELTSFRRTRNLHSGQELGTSRILLEEIERPRVGPMRDIVATIQPEQDELVRAELDESICVQGAPGTGKTAVGLHRAAYLLYLHRERLRRSGVLIVGPNSAFLSYIASVLPALGEIEVQQSTIEGAPQYTRESQRHRGGCRGQARPQDGGGARPAAGRQDPAAGGAVDRVRRVLPVAGVGGGAAQGGGRCPAGGAAVRAGPGTGPGQDRVAAHAAVGGAARGLAG